MKLNHLKNEKGSIMVIVALMFTVLMGFGALTIDIGRVSIEKSRLQNAADAAALAGASVSVANADSTARSLANLNGVDDTVSGTKIKIESYTASSETTTINYTAEEIEAQRVALTTELNDTSKTSDDDLIALANANSLTAYLTTTNGTHTAAEITSKEKALINSIGEMSDEELIKLGNHNSLDKPYMQNKNKIGDKAQLIAKLVEIQLTAFKNEVTNSITTINDKPALITALINILIEDNKVLKNGGIQSQRVKVTFSRNVSYAFASILGFKDTTVTVHAVAENASWAGDALPFINLDDGGNDPKKGDILYGWNKVGPGDKERISNDDLVVSPDNKSIKVQYEDGITFKKGKVMSKIKESLDNILVVGKTVYMFSLKHSEMPNYEMKGSKELKNKDVIPLSDVVLLECKVKEYDGKIITLEFVNSYNISASGITTATDGSKVKQSSRLVE